MAAAAAAGLIKDLLSMPSWSNLKDDLVDVVVDVVNSGLLGVLGGVSRIDVLPSLSTAIQKKIALLIKFGFIHITTIGTYLIFCSIE